MQSSRPAPPNEGASRRVLCGIVLLAAAATGCGTPMAVKRLSGEEVKAQVSYFGSLKAYFEVISKFLPAILSARLEAAGSARIAFLDN